MTSTLPPTLQSPQAQTIQTAFEAQMAHYPSVGATRARARKRKLRALEKWLLNHAEDIRQALHEDFAKPAFETDFSETFMALQEVRRARRKLKRWMRDEPVRTPLAFTGTRSWIRRESKGVCLIMAPWNFPLNLAVGPMASAIAAGNCVILKPSERTPHTSALLARMVKELFSPEEITVIEGGIPESQDLLKLPFHHLFFTGSPSVGKLVMKAAAEHLSSVTLELGGKSPAYVDGSTSLKKAAQRIAWGRFFNAGQTCVAPDYVLVEQNVHSRFMDELQSALQKFYPDGTQANPEFAQVVDLRHAQELHALGAEGENTHIPPTLLENPPAEHPAMQQEIFGPLLPVITVNGPQEALEQILEHERPLSMYIFSKKRATIDALLQQTRTGSTGINLTVAPFAQLELPFGGVNHSGLGKSHGRYGFEAFSNQRAIMKSTLPINYHTLVAPPYKGWKQSIMRLIMRWL